MNFAVSLVIALLSLQMLLAVAESQEYMEEPTPKPIHMAPNEIAGSAELFSREMLHVSKMIPNLDISSLIKIT